MYYVYALFSKEDAKFYIGYTKNIQRRVREHITGCNHTTLRYRRPQLVFFEAFLSEIDARRREKYFKTTKGRKALKLILRETLTNKENICPVV
ncbi:MAG: GIY-YIG nuclease family protein [Candidatus Omnitrophica bacterium]|nr:GIY-YIG nuclease family protein [Candidatus Omnitrophota bacterium]